jgi:hypothetical protein
MAVRVVHIRNVRVLVLHSLMVMPMRVRLSRRIIGPMHMLMVFVVHVPM